MTVNKVPKEILLVHDDAELRSETLYWRQWMIARNTKKMSRRQWLEEMSLVFASCFDVEFRFKSGVIYELPCLDEIFCSANNDDMRWLSLYLESDDTGLTPRRMSIKIERLRLISIFLKVKFPNCRRHLEN